MRSFRPFSSAVTGVILVTGFVLVPASLASAEPSDLLDSSLGVASDAIGDVVGTVLGDPAVGGEGQEPGGETGGSPATGGTPDSGETPGTGESPGTGENPGGGETPDSEPTSGSAPTGEESGGPTASTAPAQESGTGANVTSGTTSAPTRSTRSGTAVTPVAPSAAVPTPVATQLGTLPLPAPSPDATTTAGSGVGGLGVDPDARPALPAAPEPAETNPIALLLIAVVILGGLVALLLQMRAMRTGRPAPAGAATTGEGPVDESAAASRLRVLTAPTPVAAGPKDAPTEAEADYVSQLESYFADPEAESSSRRAS